jgi:sortase A
MRVIAGLMMAFGLIVLLYVAWLTWGTSLQTNTAQTDVVQELAQEFASETMPGQQADTSLIAAPDYGTPPVAAAPTYGESIGIIYVPRFGAAYSRPVIEGTDADVIDALGLGHYEGTAMPGELGNFAVAGHRQTHGAVLDNIDALQPGDNIYVQTKDGFYTYVFRNDEIVLPTGTDVLLAVPTVASGKPTERILTLTSCNPKLGAEERIIAYSTMVSWQPASAGPPAGISAQVTDLRGKK